jgi:hypothetical protein
MSAPFLLIATAAAVGVLHTIVPDHWLPIALVARQEGWTRRETVRAAGGAGVGHAISTLAIGVVVWLAGAALATRFAQTVDMLAGSALVGFGLWIGIGSLRDLHRARRDGHASRHHGGRGHAHAHPHTAHHGDPRPAHRHRHRHRDGREHVHYHAHTGTTWHAAGSTEAGAVAPFHEHVHKAAPRRALLLILGSSPMVEGIPVFFAASGFGVGLIAAMAVVFTAATTVTYVVLCRYSSMSLEHVHLGPLERYGEVSSGAVIAAVGLVFLLWFR